MGLGLTAGPTISHADASTPAGWAPADLVSAYGLPSATAGSGRTVAVVTAYDDPAAESDLAVYRSQYGLPACTTANGCFQKVNQTGGTTYPSSESGWSVDDAQSLDAISAVCPNCHILLVEANSSAIADLGAAENEAVDLGAKFIDNDWAIPETTVGSAETSYDTEYFNHPGVAITAPSGNSGYGVSYPAASQYVTAVGGTVLTRDSSAPRGWDETAWSGSGSGCSAYEPKPPWQTDSGCAGRTLNDIAAVATDVAYYDTPTTGGWSTGSGTGISAAIVAAAYALAGVPATDSYPASYLYGNAKGLYDITSGSDGTCPVSYLCTAGTGYDGPTGLGTPDGVSAFLSSYYHPITPVRFMDTRNGTGGTTGPVAAKTAVSLTIAGAHGIPSANVTAVVINVTAVNEADSGYLQAYPDGASLPGTSSLNYQPDTPLANLVIVPVGADGKIDLYNNSSGTVQFIGDVFGYFTSDASAAGISAYTPITPTRILNTASGTGAPQAKLTAGSTLAVQIGGANGIPSGISAVAINITAAGAASSGYLIDYADGTSLPGVSNLQFSTSNIAEMAIVPVGTDGKIDIYLSSSDSSNSANVIGDVVGYFAPGTAGQTYHAITGTRITDTRQSSPVAAGGTLTVSQGSTVIAPSPTLLVNVTAVDEADGGDLVIYPAGTSQPGTSNLNYTPGTTIANLDLAATGGGAFNIHNGSSGTTDIIVDCRGYLSVG